jgi:GNAT superfamily N-acetyltransferase
MDGTYFVAEATCTGDDLASASPPCSGTVIVGCGGWSKRKTLYGSDHWAGREDELLNPREDAAKIRAFFVHPDWARRGVGSLILASCEQAAKAAGFRRCEMGATLTGVKLFGAKGYVALENISVLLKNGEGLPVVRMAKQLA